MKTDNVPPLDSHDIFHVDNEQHSFINSHTHVVHVYQAPIGRVMARFEMIRALWLPDGEVAKAGSELMEVVIEGLRHLNISMKIQTLCRFIICGV